eukprot:scaffold918_cov126-Cylindrotheca_fusiformis.AAC.65
MDMPLPARKPLPGTIWQKLLATKQAARHPKKGIHTPSTTEILKDHATKDCSVSESCTTNHVDELLFDVPPQISESHTVAVGLVTHHYCWYYYDFNDRPPSVSWGSEMDSAFDRSLPVGSILMATRAELKSSTSPSWPQQRSLETIYLSNLRATSFCKI